MIVFLVLCCYMAGVALRVAYLVENEPRVVRLPPRGVMVVLLVMWATAWPLAVIGACEEWFGDLVYSLADLLRKDRQPQSPADQITSGRRQFHVVDGSPGGMWVDE